MLSTRKAKIRKPRKVLLERGVLGFARQTKKGRHHFAGVFRESVPENHGITTAAVVATRERAWTTKTCFDGKRKEKEYKTRAWLGWRTLFDNCHELPPGATFAKMVISTSRRQMGKKGRTKKESGCSTSCFINFWWNFIDECQAVI